jgi:predicted transcriptional regulator
MARKRDRLQVIHDILITINRKNGKIKPTHIMYKSNLSYQMMEEYLKELILKEFIKEKKIGKTRTYFITQKGLDYLSRYNLIIGFVDSFGLGEEII